MRVLLIDDHPVIHLGLRIFLQSSGEFTLCGAAADAPTAKRLAKELRPALIVLDLMLGGHDGVELLRELRAAAEEQAGIVVYSSLNEMNYASRVLRAGAQGYVAKDAGLETLLDALRTVSRGDFYASEAVKQALVARSLNRRCHSSAVALDHLSDREIEVFRLLGAERGSAQIAADLGLSPKTVGTYRERLKVKIGAGSARELERAAEDYFRTGGRAARGRINREPVRTP